MTPKLLPGAIADLERGREFYDLQEPGIGGYFVQRAFADIESLRLYGGDPQKEIRFPLCFSQSIPLGDLLSNGRWSSGCLPNIGLPIQP
jgi:hypothetical protein